MANPLPRWRLPVERLTRHTGRIIPRCYVYAQSRVVPMTPRYPADVFPKLLRLFFSSCQFLLYHWQFLRCVGRKQIRRHHRHIRLRQVQTRSRPPGNFLLTKTIHDDRRCKHWYLYRFSLPKPPISHDFIIPRNATNFKLCCPIKPTFPCISMACV